MLHSLRSIYRGCPLFTEPAWEGAFDIVVAADIVYDRKQVPCKAAVKQL